MKKLNSENLLHEILKTLNEILLWIKFQNISKLKEIIESFNDIEKTVYNLSNGRSSREIGKLTPVSYSTITVWWKKWAKLGIMKESNEYKGRYIHLYNLDDLNIPIPKIIKNDMEIENKNE
ncbi:MAG: helix-turn-helix domain-containing protein [Promethearchaeota archaeon]